MWLYLFLTKNVTLLSHVQTTYRQKDLEKLGIGHSMFIEIEHLVLKKWTFENSKNSMSWKIDS
jgi:hypothetical protein